MKRDIFENNKHPFTVPDGYFDSFQERIMSRIDAEEAPVRRISPYRTLLAAAACIVFIFLGAYLFNTYVNNSPKIAELFIDDDFYQWFYESDRATAFSESLNIDMPETISAIYTEYSEEDEAIIRFLERENINIVAIVHSIDNKSFIIP